MLDPPYDLAAPKELPPTRPPLRAASAGEALLRACRTSTCRQQRGCVCLEKWSKAELASRPCSQRSSKHFSPVKLVEE